MDLKEMDILLKNMQIFVENLSEDYLLGSNLGMDSQEVIELACHIEDKFSVQLSNDFLNRDVSVKNIIDNVNTLMEKSHE
jgi:acyl carrier protein